MFAFKVSVIMEEFKAYQPQLLALMQDIFSIDRPLVRKDYDRLEDIVHTTASTFLGLTVKCARCHAHKFDPILQEDYYRMASAFWAGPIAARDRKLLGGPSAEEVGYENVLAWTDLSPNPANSLRPHSLHRITFCHWTRSQRLNCYVAIILKRNYIKKPASFLSAGKRMCSKIYGHA